MRRERPDPHRVRALTVPELGELATDVGPDARTIGVLLRLGGPAPSEETLARLVSENLPTAPRWACRVRRRGRGRRPCWEPVPDFDARAHVRTVPCPSADEATDPMLAAFVRIAREPWDLDAPPWRLTRVVVGGGRDALALTLHHVLADGPGVLATAGALLGMMRAPRSDGMSGSGRTDLAHRLGRALRTAARAAVEVAAGVGPGARRTSLRVPLRPGFRLEVVDLDLDRVLAAARRHGATVNDVLLVAVGRALGELLARRGESTDRIVVSVPVTRPRTGETDPRVRTGILRVPVPVGAAAAGGSAADPAGHADATVLRRVARLTARRRQFATGESSVPLAQVFRGFAALGLYRWILEHQRVIDTVVTNVRGPVEPLNLAGVPVVEVVPLAPGVGNVPVFFVALSYAGRLTVSVRADDQLAHELPTVAAALRATVDRLATPT